MKTSAKMAIPEPEAPPKGIVIENVIKIENNCQEAGNTPLPHILDLSRNIAAEEFGNVGTKVSSTVAVASRRKSFVAKNTFDVNQPLQDFSIENPISKSKNGSEIKDEKELAIPGDKSTSSRTFLEVERHKVEQEKAKSEHEDDTQVLFNGDAETPKRNTMFTTLIIPYASLFKKHLSSFKRCIVRIIHKTGINKQKYYCIPKFLKRKSMIKNNIAYPAEDNSCKNKRVKVTNLEVEKNTHLHLRIGDDTRQDTSEDSLPVITPQHTEYRINHKRPKHCKLFAERRSPRVIVLTSSEESVHTTFLEDQQNGKASNSLAPDVVESANDTVCGCGHHLGLNTSETEISHKIVMNKIKRKDRSPTYYILKVPHGGSDSDGFVCLTDEENVFTRKIRRGKNYIMKQVKSHSNSVIKMRRSWMKKFKKRSRTEVDDSYSENEIECKNKKCLITKRSSKYNSPEYLCCSECIEKVNRERFLNEPCMYSITGMDSVLQSKKGKKFLKKIQLSQSHEMPIIKHSKGFNISENVLDSFKYDKYLHHPFNCRCVACKTERKEYEKYIPNKYTGCKCTDCEGEMECLCKNCFNTMQRTKTSRQTVQVTKFCKCCKCDVIRSCSKVKEEEKHFDFYEKDLVKIEKDLCPMIREPSPMKLRTVESLNKLSQETTAEMSEFFIHNNLQEGKAPMNSCKQCSLDSTSCFRENEII